MGGTVGDQVVRLHTTKPVSARSTHVGDLADFWAAPVKKLGAEDVRDSESEQVLHEPQSRQVAFGVVRVVPRVRVQQHTAEQDVPQPREETVEAVRSIPCQRAQQRAVGRMVGEQSEVIEVTETASQDRKLQCTVEWTLVGLCRGCQNCPSKGHFWKDV